MERKTVPSAYVEPMKALGVERVPPGDWLLEIKFDGYRALAIFEDGRVGLWSRNRNEITASYPEIATALGKLRCSQAVLDGEIVALDESGRPSFQLLQRRGTGPRPPLLYYAFDLLSLDHRSLVDEPIEHRKKILERVLKRAPEVIKLSPVFDGKPERLLETVRQQGLEGIVAKARGSVYEPGRRSGTWFKCRIAHEQEFVIGGYTDPRGARRHFGAILIGYHEGKLLHYAGKVGTGFDEERLAELHAKFKSLAVDESPFASVPAWRKSSHHPGMTGVDLRHTHWLRPRLVAQIKFTEWTEDGSLRHPVFLGLRTDKRAREVVREALAAEV